MVFTIYIYSIAISEKEKELNKKATVSKMELVQIEGSRTITSDILI